MNLKELKCKNCGATIKVEENATNAKCEFCHSSFTVEDAYHDGYKFEKGRMKAHSEQFEKTVESAKNIIVPIGKAFAVQYIITAVIGFVIFIVIFITIISLAIGQVKDNKTKSVNENEKIINDMYDVISNGSDVIRNNNVFELYSGSIYGNMASNLIDEVINYNKKNTSKQITVKYKDISTTDSDKLTDLKKQLSDWTEYEISFEYDSNGLINLVNIEK